VGGGAGDQTLPKKKGAGGKGGGPKIRCPGGGVRVEQPPNFSFGGGPGKKKTKKKEKTKGGLVPVPTAPGQFEKFFREKTFGEKKKKQTGRRTVFREGGPSNACSGGRRPVEGAAAKRMFAPKATRAGAQFFVGAGGAGFWGGGGGGRSEGEPGGAGGGPRKPRRKNRPEKQKTNLFLMGPGSNPGKGGGGAPGGGAGGGGGKAFSAPPSSGAENPGKKKSFRRGGGGPGPGRLFSGRSYYGKFSVRFLYDFGISIFLV